MLLALGTLQGAPATDTLAYSGRAGQTSIHPSRQTGDIRIDGSLGEPQWRAAAVLTGFSEFTPIDGQPAPDSTAIRVWYSATALYIGVRAFDTSGVVHATLAARDHIFNDDNVQIFLSTFNDGRQASFFAVNPLGVQADGALNENGGLNCGMTGCGTSTRQKPDLSQDFVWDSRGRVLPDGYEVEIRIPFKSIRVQAAATQTWGINVLRTVQRSGIEETWTPVRLAASSFLAQSGTLTNLTGLEPGHVLEVVPTVTSRVTGAPPAPDGAFDYAGGAPQVGGDLRYGVTPNLTLRATAHPDFSEVGSDIVQFAFDPRQAIRYPERRPFFLDGSEQFNAPFGLVYTRRIVQPVVAGKLTGKIGNNQIGVLAAVDDNSASSFGDHPVYAIVRASHDLGPGSNVAGLWTERHDGNAVNRVLDVDGRIVVGGINSITFAGALAHDRRGDIITNAAIWNAGFRRSGRHFRMHYNLAGVPDDFITRVGQVGQLNVATVLADQSYTWLFDRGAVQNFTTDVTVQGDWNYDDFVHGGSIRNRYLHFNLSSQLQGNWNVGASYFVESFGYDPSIYAATGLLHPDGTVTPFTGGGDRLPNHDYVLRLGTPTWKHFDLNVFTLIGLNDENYGEWASGRLVSGNAQLNVRPNEQLRIGVGYNTSRVWRPEDGSRVLLQDVVSATVEYQLTRAIQFRVIGQYSVDDRDDLRDAARTGLPIVTRGPDGAWVRASAYSNRAVQTDLLFTYLPNPGTVVYLGYGGINARPDQLGRPQLAPLRRDFFVKVSYLWRISD